MEVVDFFPKHFWDIPEQDNPAFGKEECMMVMASGDTPLKVLVAHIKPNPVESVTKIATFWRHDLALKYAKDFEP